MEEQEELVLQIFNQVEKIKKQLFTPKMLRLQEREINGKNEYNALLKEYASYVQFDDIINDIGWSVPNHFFYYNAYCSVCGKDRIMLYNGKEAEHTHESGNTHFFREGFFCPECGCNARLRYMVQKIRKLYQRGMKVYLYERITPTYKSVSEFIPDEDLLGSEYFGENYQSGDVIDGILHEDAGKLSFADNSFDLMISMDVFEHTYHYMDVFKEVYRVLKPGGRMLLTIPLRPNLDNTTVRAKIENGEIVHLLEPIYHGDPMSPQGGVLEFIMYGWDIIPIIKSFGFQDVKVITYYSVNDAYLGATPFVFEIIK